MLHTDDLQAAVCDTVDNAERLLRVTNLSAESKR
jgi:hypothetical protein